MNLFDMKGAWETFPAVLYNVVVTPGFGEVYEMFANEIGEIVKTKNVKILDVGCGSGHAAMAAARGLPDAHVTAVDLSADMIRMAKWRARLSGIKNVTFQIADALELPFNDGHFDAVFSIASIKHCQIQ